MSSPGSGRWRAVALAGSLSLTLALVPAGAAYAAAPEPDSPAASQQWRPGDRAVSVMVRLDARTSGAAYRAAPRGKRGAAAREQAGDVDALADGVAAALETTVPGDELYRTSVLYPGIAVTTTQDQLARLATIPGVRSIVPLTPKKPSVVPVGSMELTRASTVWSSSRAGTGEGVTIGIIDTGIDYTHATFGGPGTHAAYALAQARNQATEPAWPNPAKVAGGYDFVGDDYDAGYSATSTPVPDPDPLDCQGHGSHVAGTAAGYGVSPDGSTYGGPWSTVSLSDVRLPPGVAPKATLYALRVFGCKGSTNVVAAALEWAADPDGDGSPSDRLDVVNMSLGSDFGSAEDPDSVAADNAALLGISVIASAGNSGDVYDVAGSPANGTRVISVASTLDEVETLDRLSVSSSQGEVAGLQDGAYDWAAGNGLSGTLKTWPESGDNTGWSSPTSAGCVAWTSGEQPFAAGDVAFLYWNTSSASYCGSRTAAQNARRAGATGVVFASSNPADGLSSIYGDAFAFDEASPTTPIPSFIVEAGYTDVLKAAVDSGAVTVASTAGDRGVIATNDAFGQADTISSFSSRGWSRPGLLKPDVSAPGDTILSAWVGSGHGGTTMSGTSMAAPHVAGLAALVLAANPGWSPEQVKAAIMNTADTDVTTTRAPPDPGIPMSFTRAGAGRIDAVDAVRTTAVAYAADEASAVSVSFGAVDAPIGGGIVTESRRVTVASTADSGEATYAASLSTVIGQPGVTASVLPAEVTLTAGQSVTVTVTLTIDPMSLVRKADPALGVQEGTPFRDFETEFAANLVLSPQDPSTPSLHVPVHAVPRPVSTLQAAGPVSLFGGTSSGTITLEGDGIAIPAPSQVRPWEAQRSLVSAFELIGSSEELPPCTDTQGSCVPGPDGAGGDLQYAGYAMSGDHGFIGLSTWGPRRTSADVVDFMVVIDGPGAGTMDRVLANFRQYTLDYEPTDVFESTMIVDSDAGTRVGAQLPLNARSAEVDTRSYDSSVMVLPFLLEDVSGVAGSGGVVKVAIATFVGGLLVDTMGFDSESNPSIELDLDAPSVQVTGSGSLADDSLIGDSTAPILLPAGDGTALSVSVAQEADTAQVLLLHQHNAPGEQAEVVAVSRQSATTETSLLLSASNVPIDTQVTATVTVSATPDVPVTGGSLVIRDGSEVLTSVDEPVWVNGSATVALPGLSLGQHLITASYSGTSTMQSSASSAAEITVSAAVPTVALSMPVSAAFGSSPLATVTVTGVRAPSGQVTLMAGSREVGRATLVGGVATIAVTGLAVGSHSLVASFAGDTYNQQKTSDPSTITIAKALPTVTLTVSASAAYGSVPPATVRVTGVSTPTGVVRLLEGTREVGRTALVNGRATISLSGLAVGRHALVAAYGGDGSHRVRSSASSALTITKAITSVSLPDRTVSGRLGGNVTLTAVVGPAALRPTGKVAFVKGSTTLATVDLVAGRAVAVVSAQRLGRGESAVKAVYRGSATAEGSTSAKSITVTITRSRGRSS